MPKCVWVAMLTLVAATMPGVAGAQHPVQVAFADPQPHFVAAWAPKEKRAAEGAAVLVRRVSLELAGVSLDAALKALTAQAGLRLTYSPAVLPASKRVTISARDVAVVTALTEMLFRSGLDVVVGRDGALALVRCGHAGRALESQASDSGAIVGRVVDKGTGAPIAGATVTVEGTAKTATTAEDGSYLIRGLSAGTIVVRARYVGYWPVSVKVEVADQVQTSLEITLQRSTQVLDEVVTVAPGGMQAEVRALPTPITVISAEDIAARRPRNIQELFRQAVPTAVSWDQQAVPYATQFSVRGATTLDPSQVQMKVFVDGLEVASPGRTPIDPQSIERVEVIRGPQAAAVYGSDAIGGVVQIFTKRGDPNRTRPDVNGQAELGLVQTPYAGHEEILQQVYSLGVTGGAPNVSYNFGGGYSQTGGYIPEGEISKQSNPSVYGGTRFSRGMITADVSGRYFAQNAPNVFNPELFRSGFFFFSRPNYLPAQVKNQSLGARFTVAGTNWWRNTIWAGIDRLDGRNSQVRPRFTTPDDTLLTIFESTQSKNSVGFNSSLDARLSKDVSGNLAVGFDHYSLPFHLFFTSGAINTTGTIRTSDDLPISASSNTINNTGYFAQAQLGFRDAMFITAGLRAENNSEFGDSLGTPVSPRVGASFVRGLRGATLKLRGSWGRAIRAPAAGSKFAQTSPTQVTLANPRLGPERQKGWDAGVEAVFGGTASLSVTYYRQTGDNLIDYVLTGSTPTATYQYQNAGRVRNTGVEVEARLRVGPAQVAGQYGYSRSRVEALASNYGGDLQVGDQALATPKHTAGASVTVLPSRSTSVVVGVTHVGSWSQYDFLAMFRCFGGVGPCRPTSRDFIVAYPSFTRLNVTISQDVTPQLSGFVSMRNATNNRAYEFYNLNPVWGRITSAGLRIRL